MNLLNIYVGYFGDKENLQNRNKQDSYYPKVI